MSATHTNSAAGAEDAPPRLLQRANIAPLALVNLGVGLLPSMEHLFSGKALAVGEGAALAKQAATARNVIFLYMTGGQSHLDTWDPKPNNKEVAGPVKAICPTFWLPV